MEDFNCDEEVIECERCGNKVPKSDICERNGLKLCSSCSKEFDNTLEKDN